MPYFAVRKGRQPGIYKTWEECEKNVNGVLARFQKFETAEEAQRFMCEDDPKDAERTTIFNPWKRLWNKRKRAEEKAKKEQLKQSQQSTESPLRKPSVRSKKVKKHARAKTTRHKDELSSFQRTVTLQKKDAGKFGFTFKNGKITNIATDSPASRDGLTIDQKMTSVNGKNVVGLKDKEINEIIGQGGRTVTITIVPTFISKDITKDECKKQVDGVVSRFKKFKTLEEAEEFMVTKDPRDAEKTRRFHAEPTKKNTGTKRKKEEDHDERSGKRTKPDVINDDPNRVVVYSDGSCISNGKRGAKAGIGVYWADGDPRNVSERLQGLPQTNQRAELNAAVRALEIATNASDINKLEIRTDSMYTLNAVTKWMNGWKRNGFKTAKGTDVKNRDDIVKLYNLCQKIDVKWTHVRGHQGHEGNEKADELAKRGAEL